MKREDCKVGVKVYTDDGPLYHYIIDAVPDVNDMVAVSAPESSWVSGDHDFYHIEDLYLYDEEEIKASAVKMQAKIDEAKSAFEKAFAALAEVRNRDEGPNTLSHYQLSELGLVSIKELENTIEESGWSSSSLWC